MVIALPGEMATDATNYVSHGLQILVEHYDFDFSVSYSIKKQYLKNAHNLLFIPLSSFLVISG